MAGRGEGPDRAREPGAGRVGEGCRAAARDCAAAADHVAAGGATGSSRAAGGVGRGRRLRLRRAARRRGARGGAWGADPRAGAGRGDHVGRCRDPARRGDARGSDRGDRSGAGGMPMITPGQRMPIVIATKPVDFRRGHDGLAATVQNELGLDPHSGLTVIFRSKRGDGVKILVWDGTGLVLVYKRLDEGRFAWPAVKDGVMRLSRAQFEALFEGLDWRRMTPRRVRPPETAA